MNREWVAWNKFEPLGAGLIFDINNENEERKGDGFIYAAHKIRLFPYFSYLAMFKMGNVNFFRNASIPLLVVPILFLFLGCSEDSLTEKGNKTVAKNMTASHSDTEMFANVSASSSPISKSVRVTETSASSPSVTDSIRAAESPASSAQEDIAVNDTYVDGTVPDKEQIALWSKLKFGDELDVGDLVEVHLTNNELAYLSRDVDLWGAILVRPKRREVADVSEAIGKEFEIFDLDRDGVSEIVTTVPSIDQNGEKRWSKQILKLDGWDPVILHRIEIETYRGRRIKGGRLEGRDMEVNWRITPQSVNGNPAQLIEEVYINEWVLYQGSNDKVDHITRFSNTFQYVNQKMVEYPARPDIHLRPAEDSQTPAPSARIR